MQPTISPFLTRPWWGLAPKTYNTGYPDSLSGGTFFVCVKLDLSIVCSVRLDLKKNYFKYFIYFNFNDFSGLREKKESWSHKPSDKSKVNDSLLTDWLCFNQRNTFFLLYCESYFTAWNFMNCREKKWIALKCNVIPAFHLFTKYCQLKIFLIT